MTRPANTNSDQSLVTHIYELTSYGTNNVPEPGCLTGFYGTIESGVITQLGYKYARDFKPGDGGSEAGVVVIVVIVLVFIVALIYRLFCKSSDEEQNESNSNVSLSEIKPSPKQEPQPQPV